MTVGCDTLGSCVRSSSSSGSNRRSSARSRCPNRARARCSSGSRRPARATPICTSWMCRPGSCRSTRRSRSGHETTGHVAAFGRRRRPAGGRATRSRLRTVGLRRVPAVPPVGGELLRARDARSTVPAAALGLDGGMAEYMLVPSRSSARPARRPRSGRGRAARRRRVDAVPRDRAVARVARPRHDRGRDRRRRPRPHGGADLARADAGARHRGRRRRPQARARARGRCRRRVDRGRRRRVTRQGRDQRQRCRARRRLRRGRRDARDRVAVRCGSAETSTIVGMALGTLPVNFVTVPYEASVQTTYWGSLLELTEVLALAPRAGSAPTWSGSASTTPRLRTSDCAKARSTAAPSSFRRWPSTPRTGRATSCSPTAARCASARSVRTTSAASSALYERLSDESLYLRFFSPVPRADRGAPRAAHDGRLRRRTWRSSPSSATRSSPSRATTAPATTRPRSRSRVAGRPAGPRPRHAAARAPRGRRAVERHHDVRRRHAAEQPRMLDVFADAGWDGEPPLRRRHRARAVLDRADRRRRSRRSRHASTAPRPRRSRACSRRVRSR